VSPHVAHLPPGYPGTSPGDVFHMSLPKPKQQRKKSMKSSSSAPNLSSSAPAVAEDEVPSDPFKHWKATMMDVNKMSLTQLKLLDFDGIRDVQDDLIKENKRFQRLWIPELSDDVLYEDRNLFCEFGQAVWKATQRRQEAVKSKAWVPSEASHKKKAQEKELFKYYGVKMSPKGPDVKALTKLYKASKDNDPAELERRAKERNNEAAQADAAKKAKEAVYRKTMQERMSGFGDGLESFAMMKMSRASQMSTEHSSSPSPA